MSETKKPKSSLYKAWAETTNTIAEVGVAKSGKNPHFDSQYATLPDILLVVLPEAAKFKLHVYFRPYTLITEERERCAGVVLVLRHTESGESEEIDSGPSPVMNNNIQGVCGAWTYLKRYLLTAAFMIPEHDDDGNEASGLGRKGSKGNTQTARLQPAKKVTLTKEEGERAKSLLNLIENEVSTPEHLEQLERDNAPLLKKMREYAVGNKAREDRINNAFAAARVRIEGSPPSNEELATTP